MFVYIGIMAYIFLKEKFNSKSMIAVLLLLVGNFLFLKLSYEPLNSGDFMILLATILWAGENTLSKYVLKNLSSNIVAFGRMFFGSVFIFGFLLVTGNFGDLFTLNSTQILWSIVPTLFLLGYVFTWYKGLKTISVTKASVILLLGSPITTLLNIVYTGNMVALTQVIGMIFLVGGVIIFNKSIKEVSIPKKSKFIV